MPMTAECPFCAVLIKNLPDDSFEVGVECPRCHNFFALPDPNATTDPKAKKSPPPKARTGPGPRPAKAEPEPPPPKEEAPQIVRPTLDAPEPKSTSRIKNLWGVFAFLLGSLALLGASFPGFLLPSLAVGATGLLVGVLGIKFSPEEEGTPYLPIAGSGVSVLSLLFAGIWWAISQPPKPPYEAPKFDPQQPVAVNVGSRTGGVPSGTTYQPLGDAAWPDAKEVLQKGDIRVSIGSVSLKPVEYQDVKSKKVTTKEKNLVITIQLTNVGFEKPYEYTSWCRATDVGNPNRPILRDSKGKELKLRTFGAGSEVPGQLYSAKLFPSKMIEDVLIFEAPSPKFEALRIELPASAFGGAGRLQWQISKEMISLR